VLPASAGSLLHHEVWPARGSHLAGVTVSMRVMSAGDGYRYLLASVAVGDGHRSLMGHAGLRKSPPAG